MEAGDQGVEEGVGHSPHHQVLPVPLETEGGAGDGQVGQGEVGAGHLPVPSGRVSPLEADSRVMVLAGSEGSQGRPAQLVEADQDLGEDQRPRLHPGVGRGEGVAQLPVPVLLTHCHVTSGDKKYSEHGSGRYYI